MNYKKIRIMSILGLSIMFFFSASAQNINDSFFNNVDVFLKEYVENGKVHYSKLKNNAKLESLINQVGNADISNLDEGSLQAFYINAYNLHVINKVAQNYPTNSVMQEPGFFDRKKIKVANEQLTLNQLEKVKLLKQFKDARFHFVLVCGANGCPPITNFAYTPHSLDAQLDKQTKLALNNQDFIKQSRDVVELSEIFKWYASDFGNSNENIISFINKYRDEKISNSTRLKYYTYDWLLNDASNDTGNINNTTINSNESRYVVSSTIPKGSFEFKLFNNLYSQQTGSIESLTDRSSFFTTSLSALYGLNNRFNIGISTRFRKVRNNPLPSSAFSVFRSDSPGNSRLGLTAIGPQVRYAPNPKWKNFSIQSSLVFAIGNDLSGNSEQPYIDWDGATWNTQFFNDFSIGTKFSLFTEIDLLWEDIGSLANGHSNRISTPVTGIFSYIPTNKLTIYALAGYSPYWASEFDYFRQYGIGSKYQFTPNFELEVLYTDFSNKGLNISNGQAETINLGLRINL